MDNIPPTITNSHLWKALDSSDRFKRAIVDLRSTAEAIGAKAAETIPEYTDHSVRHMDALWEVADQVFTSVEIQKFTVGEAFVLACAFYIHDLGMSLAATEQGRQELEESDIYKSTYSSMKGYENSNDQIVRIASLKVAARELHAHKAANFIDDKIPGLDRYLIESTELRKEWGDFIGQVAASHHWSLQEVDKKLGVRNKVPCGNNGSVDLGFLACSLRIIDYAHINASRASSLDRLLRADISSDSLKHWNAQSNITGPFRDGSQLVFGSTRPISDVDAWWTFYEMANGLEREISAVADYLSGRSVSKERFSLEGVRSVKSPQSFATLVQTENFEPVDIRFRPDSMERLVNLLGGKTLYGQDYFAPIRELMQNARDAIFLQAISNQLNGVNLEVGQIDVILDVTSESGTLSISDNGIGMTDRIITNYLLGIAADYWNSSDFSSDFPKANSSGFQPVGRFGIGFLSTFMMGEEVEVQTQRRTGKHFELRLRGVGRRGSLVESTSTMRNGTTIKVTLLKDQLGNYDSLHLIVKAKAPMLDFPVTVTQQNETVTIDPGWWKTVSQDELRSFLERLDLLSTTPAREIDKILSEDTKRDWLRRHKWQPLNEVPRLAKWPGQQPEVITESSRIIAAPFANSVVLCSKGFVIANINVPGMIGLADVGEVELNASRSQTLNLNEKEFRRDLMKLLRPQILVATNNLAAQEQDVPSRFGFLADIAMKYGRDLLVETSLPWLTVMEAPGYGRLLSPQDVRELVQGNNEVFIAFGKGVGPWKVGAFLTARAPEASSGTVVIPVSAEGQPGLEYEYEEVIRGPLPHHFKKSKSGSQWNIERNSLLLATLDVIAQAWKVEMKELYDTIWSSDRGVLCGYLTHK